MLIRHLTLSAALLILPQSALALSCMQPSPENSLRNAAAYSQNTNTALVTAKVLTTDTTLEKETAEWKQVREQSMEGQTTPPKQPMGQFIATIEINPIQGVGPTGNDFLGSMPDTLDITITQNCMGPWCSGFPSQLFDENKTHTLVIQTRPKENLDYETPWIMPLSACGGQIFQSLSPEDADALRALTLQ